MENNLTLMQPKFTPGSFLEINDMHGGRTVVLVCRDGMTYWDVFDAQAATPLMIMPDLQPVEIGTMGRYVTEHGLQTQLRSQIVWLRSRANHRVDDPIFFMRMLWYLVTFQSAKADDATLETAYRTAEQQEKTVLGIHQLVGKFREVTG